jgi:hypothetical protein
MSGTGAQAPEPAGGFDPFPHTGQAEVALPDLFTDAAGVETDPVITHAQFDDAVAPEAEPHLYGGGASMVGDVR